MRSITSKTIILGLALIFLPYGELRANEGAIATLTASDVTAKTDGNKKEMNSEECYDPANIGKIGKPEWAACADMLIVDYSMLYSAASEVIGGNESFTIHHKGRSFTFSQDGNDIFTGQMTDMPGLFQKTNFTGDIEYWDVSNVTNMGGMFAGAEYFNQPLGDWDVSNVSDMSNMFYNADAFNQPLADWDVGNVTNMKAMFTGANAFNQLLADWDVGNVKKCASFAPSLKASNKPNFSECD